MISKNQLTAGKWVIPWMVCFKQPACEVPKWMNTSKWCHDTWWSIRVTPQLFFTTSKDNQHILSLSCFFLKQNLLKFYVQPVFIPKLFSGSFPKDGRGAFGLFRPFGSLQRWRCGHLPPPARVRTEERPRCLGPNFDKTATWWKNTQRANNILFKKPLFFLVSFFSGGYLGKFLEDVTGTCINTFNI